MKRKTSLLFAILVLGTILRLLYIQTRGIWYDDAFSYFLARRDFDLIVKGTAADTMPPLYYFLLHFFILVSRQLWWMRLLNVILGVGLIFLLYRVAALWVGEDAGLWAAFLAAISPIHIYHAQELRMYVILTFSQLGYVWFFSKLWMKDGGKNLAPFSRWRDWIGLVLCGAAAMYSHNLALFVLVVPDFFLLLKRRWKDFGRLLIAQAVIGVIALPWLLMIPGQVEKIQTAFWTLRPGVVEIVQAVVSFTSALPLPGFWLSAAILISIETLGLIVFQSIKHRKFWRDKWLVLLLGLFPPAAMFAVSYVMRPIFVPRGYLMTSLVYFILAGVAISQVHPRFIGGLIAGGFMAAACFSLPYQYTFAEFPRSPYKSTVDFLEKNYNESTIILHDNKLSAFPMLYYTEDLPQRFLADEPGSHNDTYALPSQEAMGLIPDDRIDTAVQGAEFVYFVVYSQAIEEYLALGNAEHPNIHWLSDRGRLEGHYAFGDLEVYQFDLGISGDQP